jgi:3-hydroxyacyl-CoA dehydrogenase
MNAMAWEERMRAAAVLGAGGKMGSGIAWVALKCMADLDAKENGVPGSGKFDLALIDANPAAFRKLREYLKSQLVKSAEKAIGDLRAWAKERRDLIENADIIDAYVDGALSMLRCESDASAAKPAKVVFEAVFEDLALKRELYSRLKTLCGPDTVFLTNTSSIPISLLDKSAGLDGRILGFHFYNPPAVQKLVEMISGAGTRPEVIALGKDLGKAFGKIVVPSNDVAGFIGNGHFIRELLFALRKFRELSPVHGEAEALVLLNQATQDFLIRPMGVFQLLDYVGLDVFQMITRVMREHLGASEGAAFADETLDALLAAGVRGGQLGSGEQKDGLFKYERNKIAAVLDPASLKSGKGISYVSIAGEDRVRKTRDALGPLPDGHVGWGALAKDPAKKEKVSSYLNGLARADSPGARLAREFLDHSRSVGQALVRAKVAATDEDVSKVLTNGFFHVYGPADWVH